LPANNLVWSWAHACLAGQQPATSARVCARATAALLDPEVIGNAERIAGPGPSALLVGMANAILAAQARKGASEEEARAAAAYQEALGGLGDGVGATAARIAISRLLDQLPAPRRAETGLLLGDRDNATVVTARFWSESISGLEGPSVPDPVALGMLALGQHFL